ncbi:flagellar filament capping protein FliD [bacterium]|nr:flagellar filament capping protein FliD [bacterium]
MAGISFGGIASGLPPNIVEQLMEAERIPIKNLENKKSKSEDRLKLVNDLDTRVASMKNSIGTLASAKGFNDIKLISGDPNIIQGSVDPAESLPGNWNIEIIQLAQKASAVTNGFPDKDQTELGTGYFRFETTDGDKEVYISGANSTLSGAANAINRAGLGIRATVINDRTDAEAPFKLMLSGENVGNDHEIKYPTLYFLDGDQDIYFDQDRQAKNGIIKVDGFEMAVADNQVEDVIPGVVLDLKQAAPGRQVNVTVKEDREVVGGKVKEFVDSVNSVLGFIQEQNRLTDKTDTSRTLGGDGLIRNIENRLRSLLQGSIMGVGGKVTRLNQLGIGFNRNGLLDFDQEKFNSVLASDPDSVQQFIAGDGFSVGFVPALKRTIANMQSGNFSPIANRKRSLEQKIDQANKRIESKERQLDRKEQTLRKKFANLESQMSKLKGQGGQVAALSSAIPNFGGASKG